MRLRKTEIHIVSEKIIKRLIDKGLVEFTEAAAAQALVEQIITDDLMVEDHLNDEVRNILSQHADEMQSKGMEYHRMFSLVKARLAKKRNLIL